MAKVVGHWGLDQRVTGSNPGQVPMFAFLAKCLIYIAAIHPGVQMGTCEGRAWMYVRMVSHEQVKVARLVYAPGSWDGA